MENIINTAIGIETWGSGNRKTRGKASKLDMIRDISKETNTKALDIGVLNLKDLTVILKAAKEHSRLAGEIPQGNRKDPYLERLGLLFPNMTNLKKLPVASLKALVGAFSNG